MKVITPFLTGRKKLPLRKEAVHLDFSRLIGYTFKWERVLLC